MDSTGGREEGEGAGDDFITWLHTCGQQCEDQGIGTGGATDGVFGSAVGGNFLFELHNFIPKDEGLAFEAAIHSGSDFFAFRRVLRNEVDEGHGGP